MIEKVPEILSPIKLKRFETLLRRKNLKVTSQRLSILNNIYGKETATSQPELEKELGTVIDRVTLYRALAIFEEKGILHKIFDLNGTATYAICSPDCSEHDHHDEHVHFTCKACNGVYCLDKVRVPKITLPSGFKLDTVGIQVTGICHNCMLVNNNN